jgi:probable F420-dependent oxidoreductase
MPTRWGLTIPLNGVPLTDHAPIVAAAADAGFTDFWSAETNGTDAFVPLALAAGWAPSAQLGTAIVPVFTRGPALIAMSAATLAEVATGRFTLGIGASSPAIVHAWNGIDFADPFGRARDVLRFLRRALAGELVDEEFASFTIRRFKLEKVPQVRPRVSLAALRRGMLRLAAAEADGVILNWLAATDLPRVTAELTDAPADFDVAARIFVCPTEDAATARAIGKRLIAAYLTVPVYEKFHRWLGRGPALDETWRLWAAGDRKGAVAAVPDSVADELILHGTPASVRAQLQSYVDGGVRTPVAALVAPPGADLAAAVAALAPTAKEDATWS